MHNDNRYQNLSNLLYLHLVNKNLSVMGDLGVILVLVWECSFIYNVRSFLAFNHPNPTNV